MDLLTNVVTSINNLLWSYVLIATLIACGLWFTFKTKFVQFGMIGHMFKLLLETGTDKVKGNKQLNNSSKEKKERKISSFEAFAVSIAGRVGTGNLAGVATAIVIGGPGAVFWMWVIALIGSASAFIESTLAQLFKLKGKDSFLGGPAYYIEIGLKMKWLSVSFAIFTILTFGFAFNSVQSNTLSAALSNAFSFNPTTIGIVLTIFTALIIFGGIQSIAKVSSVIVPIMAIGYVLIAVIVIIMNITELPSVIKTITSNAFGFRQAVGGGIGAALMQGIRRGLFSNEAGMGSAPHAAATANVTHPVKQGFIQALSVFTDTLLICSCTAFIILFSGSPVDGTINGVQLTQHALNSEIGDFGTYYIGFILIFFVFSSILGNYYYGEANVAYLVKEKKANTQKRVIFLYRVLVAANVMAGAVMSLDLAWNIADITMGMMALCNMTGIVLLGKYAIRLLDDYKSQLKAGKDPVFNKDILPEIKERLECW
ncbi:MAG: alanine:cation symporter family protein [Bacteroidales bacterium]|nr:alanine:cation symporter family protein [Bacteroidales bacterium]